MRPKSKLFLCAVTAALAFAHPTLGQGSRLPGSIEAGLMLRQLDGVKRTLIVAAHPDDEDTSLLTTLALGWGVEAAYFSFTRGEGGQNLIGTELGEGLGIIRSEELLAARRIDGAGQYFGRAFDFGYSKSADETFDKWPREILLSDLVWVIRRFRPHVLVTMWGGTPRDGHGQHQVAGLLTREAFEAAGDPDRFPDQLRAGVETWAPLKLYRRALFDPDAATLEIATGRLDPLLGRSHHQIAMDSRSQHRSQGFGSALPPGPRTTRLALTETRVESSGTDRLFAGVDTTLAALGAGLGAVGLTHIATYREALRVGQASLSAADPGRALGPLSRALTALDRARALVSPQTQRELQRELDRRHTLLGRAILALAGVRVELRARDDVLVPGQKVLVEARVWSGAEAEVDLSPPTIVGPEGWRVQGLARETPVEADDTGPFARFFRQEETVAEPGMDAHILPNELRLWRYEVTVPDDAPPTSPYFLEQDRDGEVYRWPTSPETRALPFRPPLLSGEIALTVTARGTSTTISVSSPVRFRGVSGTRGEFWRPILVAPRVSVAPEAGTLIWPTDRQGPREISFRLRSRDAAGISGSLHLDLSPGWHATPDSREFDLSGEGTETTLTFSIEPPELASEGEFLVRAIVRTRGGDQPAVNVTVIDYPHIEPRLIASNATVRIVRFPVRVADRRVGYVMGSGDEVPEAIRQLGVNVELIEAADWDDERLDRFDTIVLGVRAYEVRDDLISANPILLRWVERGGTLLVQYNRYEFNQGEYAPYPISIGRPAPRVTDENAVVTILEEAAPPLIEPNRIGASDFEGWVQERGLYFPDEWDERYHALLEMADPDEPPRRGSLLAAPYGRGLYIHTSLSFFRQLPAGVPGAYRLWANLISLDARRWREITTP